ncbi:hypothetical protein KKE48_04145 [Patescibacteria group bacterium]|nr:hypothetical protein [Patescibacteria group bacterium]MBU1500030.1 hypothetical protein [Patescibacteria group bacterium]
MKPITKKIALMILVIITLSLLSIPFLITIKKKPVTTGAIITPLDPEFETANKSLYELLLENPYDAPGKFIIKPLPEKRLVEIYIYEPYDQNQILATEWLQVKNYEKVPEKNILWIKL